MKTYERHRQTVQMRRTPVYQAWVNMRMRCSNRNRPDFSQYGGRGITVCDRWKNSFANFLNDMGERPEGMSLDRIDNELGYSPENCRWATKDQQMQNTRATRLIEFGGLRMGMTAWARRLGINKESLRIRLQRWPIEKALTAPAKGGGK